MDFSLSKEQQDIVKASEFATKEFLTEPANSIEEKFDLGI
jgi:hypothetical protein